MIGRLLEIARFAVNARRLYREKVAEIEDLRSRIDLGQDIVAEFGRARESGAYRASYEKAEPLISVCIPTYNRGRLLQERAIPSVLNQTYRKLELIVVGDCCPDDTPERMKAITDPRFKFINLPERGRYPENPDHRWLVAGTAPANCGLELATGDFITDLDDDDAYEPTRLERLVAFLKQTRADVVWHPYWTELPDGKWIVKKSELFRFASVQKSAVICHNWFRRIPYDNEAWKWSEPGDWNRFRKLRYLGARIERCPEILLRHFKERTATEP